MTVSSEQRRFIRHRAGDCCEYCRLSQNASFARFQIDHILAASHGGEDTNDNLCLACPDCNGHKGTNVAALDPLTDAATRLYNPRRQAWGGHFAINDDATISGLTPEGRTTVFVLRLNDFLRVKQRRNEMESGAYPC